MKHRFNVLYDPMQAWPQIAAAGFSVRQVYLRFILLMAAIPPAAAFVGAVYSGWRIGFGEPVRLTWQSALLLSIAAYVAILVGLYLLARLAHWMARTYDSDATLDQALVLVAYSAGPLFLVSIFSVYPVLWINMLLTLLAAALSIRILFTGTPVMMSLDHEKGLMFSNAIMTVAMVMLVGVLAVTVLFWGFGLGPAFTR